MQCTLRREEENSRRSILQDVCNLCLCPISGSFSFFFFYYSCDTITKNSIPTRINKNNDEISYYLNGNTLDFQTSICLNVDFRRGWFNGPVYISIYRQDLDPFVKCKWNTCHSWIHLYIYIYILRLYFWIRWFQRNTSWRVYTSGIRFHGTKGKIFPSWLTFRGSSQARIGEYSCSPLWNVRGNATHETQIHCSWHSRISLPSSLSSLSLSLSLSIHRWTLKAVTTGWERHR